MRCGRGSWQMTDVQNAELGALHARVLIADDVPDAARSLAMLCELYGAEVRFALDGVSALRSAESFQPDVVLLDIGMPDMDGYEVARAIRAAPWGVHVVLIALTGWGRSADLHAAHLAGFDAHLLKPADPEQLLRLIDRLLARRAPRSAHHGADGTTD